MKHFTTLFVLASACLLFGCSANDNKGNTSSIRQSATKLANENSADITHKNGWTIINKMENMNRVYWFLAPDENGRSPALFKKTVFTDTNSELKMKTVSECEAPKQTCDDLLLEYKSLSDDYR